MIIDKAYVLGHPIYIGLFIKMDMRCVLRPYQALGAHRGSADFNSIRH